MVTWDGTRYESINMPDYLADDYVREFDLAHTPKTIELKEISFGNYSIEHLQKGIYMLLVTSNERKFQSKIIRM
jgi:hypothetical protein